MKKTLITFALLPLFLFAQEPNYKTIVLFDAAAKTSNSIIPIYIGDMDNGALIEVIFTSINCDELKFNVGYTITDEYPLSIDSIPKYKMPITLDKTVFSKVYRGIENNVLEFDLPSKKGNYLWAEIIDNAACTSGEVILKIK